MTRNHALVGWSILVLLILNGLILQKENHLQNARPVMIKLAPVDPRSLMQGDYMALNFEMPVDWETFGRWPDRGTLVMKLDSRGVASFTRFHEGSTPLGTDEILLGYRKNKSRVAYAADSFFFQEGQREEFAKAKYAELRVTSGGQSLLAELRDENLAILGAKRP